MRKPFAINHRKDDLMINTAEAHKNFLMEVIWTRFVSIFVRLRQGLEKGTIRKVKMLTANFGFCARFDPRERFSFRSWGVLLDLGVYTVFYLRWYLDHRTRFLQLSSLCGFHLG